MILELDQKDFIEALNQAEVRYMVVGGYAVIFHGYGRFTMDIDIWVDRTPENYTQILKAFQIFGMPLFGMTREKFLENKEMEVFTFGRPPCSIDLMVTVKGLEFSSAFEHSLIIDHQQGIQIRYLSKEDLFLAKKAAGRTKDKLDIEELGGSFDS